jgi:RNA polymerase sigma-70 factor, ECF subfamily
MTGLCNAEVADIYRRYGHLLLRRCRQRMRNDAAAEDVLQEAFVKILRYGAAYQGAESKLGWLYQVVDRCCYDACKRGREPVATAAQLDEGAGAARPRLTNRIHTQSALGRLPEQDRQLAVLAFVDGLSQQQIAAEVGWSRQTVNRKLQTIRERLGRWLRGD